MGISRCTLTFAAEHVRSFETVITLFTPSTLSSCHMTLAFALPNSCVTRFNRSQSAICITVTWLASQRVFHLKIKCKGFTVITIIPSHVVLAHAVCLKRKKSQVTISLSVLKQWNLLTQKQIIVLIYLYTEVRKDCLSCGCTSFGNFNGGNSIFSIHQLVKWTSLTFVQRKERSVISDWSVNPKIKLV